MGDDNTAMEDVVKTEEEGKMDNTEAEVAAALAGVPASSDGARAEDAAKGGDVSKANKNTLPIRAYLDQTVVPILLQALSQLVKERPDGDEVEFICHWMLRNNPNKKS
jgi:protein dpy-30